MQEDEGPSDGHVKTSHHMRCLIPVAICREQLLDRRLRASEINNVFELGSSNSSNCMSDSYDKRGRRFVLKHVARPGDRDGVYEKAQVIQVNITNIDRTKPRCSVA